MKLLGMGLRSALLLACPAFARAAVLVNLDATALPAGPLATWNNSGSVTGNFVSSGTVTPAVTAVGGVNAVTLDNAATGNQNFYVGPGAPASVAGATTARSIEVWANNPSFVGEETMVAWGRRGGPAGSNMSFNYGNNGQWGAVGHWDAPDLGWDPSTTSTADGTANPPAAGIWHHLVYTYDGNTTRVYSDGVLANSEAVGQLSTYEFKADGVTRLPFVIGGQNSDASPYNAVGFNAAMSIARVRVHDTVLTPAQITAQFNAEAATFGRTTPTVPTFTASSSVFYSGQPITLTWATTQATTVTIDNGVGTVATSGSVVVSPTAATTYTLTATNPSGSAAKTVTVTPPVYTPSAVVHRWSFNEASGNTVNDSVGTSHGTIVNATSGTNWTRVAAPNGGPTPGQVSLPGGASATAPYIDLPNNSMQGLTQVTFEGWMTLNGTQNWSRYFDFGTNSSGEINAPGGTFSGTEVMLVSAQVGATTTQRRISMKDNNVEQNIDVNDTVTYGQEFHFAVVYDSTGNNGAPRLSYYKNGTLVGGLNTTFRPQDLVFVNNWLGRSNWSGDNNTNGAYNEFRIWNGPLTPDMVQASLTAGPDGTPPAPALAIQAFNVYPSASIYRGEAAKLSWWVTDPGNTGASVSINNGAGVTGSTNLFDNAPVSPSATTTYTLTATNGAITKTATQTVVVLPAEPSTQSLTTSTSYQTAVDIGLIASDPNTPLASLSYTIVTPPAHGTLSGTGATRTYTPAAGYSGPDSFTYKANDGLFDSNVSTVAITVNPPPVPPTDLALNDGSLRTDDGVGNFIGRLRATDANPDDTFTWQLVAGAGDTNNSWFSIVGNQLISQHDFSGNLNTVASVRVKVTDSTGNSIEKVLTLPVKAADLHVKINEIYYNSPNNLVAAEFIELYNPFGTAVDVSGWQFTKGVNYQFPTGTSIPPNGYLVIAEDPATIQSLHGATALGPWSGGLSSDGDTIVLANASGVKVDEVQYGITAPWPTAPNGDGPSLELINTNLDNDLGGHWRAAVSVPTSVTYVPKSSTGWRYRKGTSEASSPIGAWRANGFAEDASWFTGAAPIGLFKINSNTSVATFAETGVTLGTQLTDMATYASATVESTANFTAAYTSAFFRKEFTVNGTPPSTLWLRVMHNDAAIVWINGREVARFGFAPNAPTDPPYNYSAIYERGNDPWSELFLTGATGYLTTGTNVLTIEGFAKNPRLRGGPNGQDDAALYNVFDFAIDAELKNASVFAATPGAQNSTFATNAPPAVRQVDHSPKSPKSSEPIVVTAKISDRQGLGTVQVKYQVVAPGAYVPATLPLTIAQILANNEAPRNANPAFESAANWTTVPMVDDGTVAGDVPGDGIFTARIPAQPNRSLVRYRIFATDLAGTSVQAPQVDDPRKNFAAFVYDGVPDYVNGSSVFAAADLTKLPVYQWIMRDADLTSLLAYAAGDQFANTNALNVLLGRRYYNFEGTMVYDGKVYDHVDVRLRGGNSRYNGAGKRHFRFKFPKGNGFLAKDNKGREYPRPWEDMLFNKMFGNKGDYDWGLTYTAGAKLWALQGVPTPFHHWVHFRVIRGASEAATPATGDFWGLYQALELPEGKNFLKSRDLPAGNFYKMSDFIQNGEMDERYQAAGAPDFGEDFDNIRYNIHPTTPQVDMEKYVNMPLWYRYNAVQEAIRHYDIFIEPTGRHRVKNLYWYFHPGALNPDGSRVNPLGQCWFMPYDWDASFGPNWNNGYDFVNNAIYNRNPVPDSPTWTGITQNRAPMQIEHRNAIRELRDLVFYRGTNGRGPVDDILDDAMAVIEPFWRADAARWPAPGANSWISAPGKVADMKAFCFTGWSTIAGEPVVGAGGRAAYLDTISDTLDAGQLPTKPTLTFSGSVNYPVDGLVFTSSAFADPQGANTFAALQWRVGEVTDPSAPAYDPAADRLYEADAVWTSPEITTFTASIQVPAGSTRVGHAYRARVRHKDNTGRWSHWSDPLQFTTTTPNALPQLQASLVISEFMYKSAAPSNAELAAGYTTDQEFDWIELHNISPTVTLDLTDVRFTKGVDFDFAGSAITSLAPGAYALVVKNAAAFAMRYGPGKPIAGQWQAGDNLSNGGEQLKLSFGAGTAIRDFTYDDVAPWPVAADLGGYSLVLVDEATNPDHALPASWRASSVLGGTPGTSSGQTLAAWMAANGFSDPNADPDGNGLTHMQTFAFGADLRPISNVPALETIGGERFLTFTFNRRRNTEGLTYTTQVSADLAVWDASAGSSEILATTDNGDGTETVKVKVASAVALQPRVFVRCRVTQP